MKHRLSEKTEATSHQHLNLKLTQKHLEQLSHVGLSTVSLQLILSTVVCTVLSMNAPLLDLTPGGPSIVCQLDLLTSPYLQLSPSVYALIFLLWQRDV